MTKHIEYIRDGRAPIPEKAITSKIMSGIKDKNTKPELLLRKALWNYNIKGYRLHWNKVPGRPDITFPGKKIAIFVNGCFWHRCPYCSPSIPKSHSEFWREKFRRNIARDKKNLAFLEQKGWTAIVLWECQIKSDLKKSLDIIKITLDKNA